MRARLSASAFSGPSDARRMSATPGRDEGPVAPKRQPGEIVGGHRARLGAEHRLMRANRIGPQRPHDLHVVRFVERREVLRVERAESRIRVPGLGHGTHDDFPTRHFCKDAPSERQHLRQQGLRSSPFVRRAAERQLPGLEYGADHGRAEQVLLVCGSQRDRGWCSHPHVVTFDNLVGGHEAVQEWIHFIRSAGLRSAVVIPGEDGRGCIGCRGDTKPRGDHAGRAHESL